MPKERKLVEYFDSNENEEKKREQENFYSQDTHFNSLVEQEQQLGSVLKHVNYLKCLAKTKLGLHFNQERSKKKKKKKR